MKRYGMLQPMGWLLAILIIVGMSLAAPLSADPGRPGGGNEGNVAVDISGVVVAGDTDAPVADATVSLIRNPNEPLQQTQTNARGRFVFESRQPGRYVILAEAEGYQPTETEVIVHPREPVEVRLGLTPLVAETGNVMGTVVDRATSDPLAGAKVYYRPEQNIPPRAADDGGVAPEWRFVETNPRGHYLIEDLAPGVYVLSFRAEGYHPQERRVRVAAGDMAEANAALQPRIVEQPGAIFGVVVDQTTNDPIAGALVYFGQTVADGSAPAWFADPGGNIPHVRTNERGQYRIARLLPGRYHLTARAEGYQGAHQFVAVEAGGESEANFALEPFVRPDPGIIQGQVFDLETSAPIEGAMISFGALTDPAGTPEWWREGDGDGTTPPNRPHVLTDARGRYVIENVPPGAHYLLAEAEGHRPRHARVEVESGETVQQDFVLVPIHEPRPGAIAGHVVDAGTSDPLAGVRVSYVPLVRCVGTGDPNNAGDRCIVEPEVVETNERGRFVIEGLRPGAYELNARLEGYRPRTQRLSVREGEVTTTVFALEPHVVTSGTVAGVVFDARTTAPLAGVHVLVTSAIRNGMAAGNSMPERLLGEAETDRRGHYRIAGIPAEPVVVRAALAGYQPAQQGVRVPDGAAVRVNFALRPAPEQRRGHIVGDMRDGRNDRPLKGAFVVLMPQDRDGFRADRRPDLPPFALTDKDGQFAFRGVPAGAYRVQAVKHKFEPATHEAVVRAGESTRVRFILEHERGAARFGALSGRVIDGATSEPLAHAMVRLHKNVHEWLTDPDGHTTFTDERGFYHYRKLKVGVYGVRVNKPGYRPAEKNATIRPGQETRCSFALRPRPPRGVVAGVVLDNATSEPVAGAIVFVPPAGDATHAARRDNAPHAQTDRRGRYRITNVPPGEQTIVALHRRYLPQRQAATVTTDTVTTVNFALEPCDGDERCTWTIRVRDRRTSRPLAGVRLRVPVTDWLANDCEWDPWAGVTNRDGVAVIGGVPRHGMSLVALLEGHEAVVAALEADPAAGSGQQELALTMDLDRVLALLGFIDQQYADFLSRDADLGGRLYYLDLLQNGELSLEAVVRNFIASPEFAENTGFVARCYFTIFNNNAQRDCLDPEYRIPDYDGLRYWVAEMRRIVAEGGSPLEARLHVIRGFLNSPEWQARVGDLTDEEFVEFIYEHLLGRAAETEGRGYHLRNLGQGLVSRETLIQQFIESPESVGKYGNATYVVMAYLGLLDRAAEKEGFDFHLRRMRQGDDATLILGGFIHSPEYESRLNRLGRRMPRTD